MPLREFYWRQFLKFGVDPAHFSLVTMRANPIGGAGYISLGGLATAV
jgi:hypothetical protein